MTNSLKPENSVGWYGHLNLVYAYDRGTTKLIHDRVQAPLKVQRPFYPEGSRVCHSVILHTAGGVVGGDRSLINLHAQANSQALITTAAAGKVYRSNGLQAQQTIQVQVDTGASFEWLPQETIIFNGAIYRQDLQVQLAPDAIWLGWDITRFGRTARGEKFCSGEWRSHTEVWQQGKPLWIDRLWLPASEAIYNSPHGLATQPVVGSFAFVGQAVSSDFIEKVRLLWSKVERKGEVGVTRLTTGLICRYRGASTSDVRQWFQDIWQLLRLSTLGRPAVKLRIFPV